MISYTLTPVGSQELRWHLSKKIERFDNSQGLSRFNVEVKHDSSLFSDNCIVIFCWECLDEKRFEISFCVQPISTKAWEKRLIQSKILRHSDVTYIHLYARCFWWLHFCDGPETTWWLKFQKKQNINGMWSALFDALVYAN